MSCLICAGPAERIASLKDWEERRCLECGHYRIADALILTLMDQGQIFDVVKARAWVRAHQHYGAVPEMITAQGLLQL